MATSFSGERLTLPGSRREAPVANPLFYAQPSAFRDVVSGTNGAYTAGPGWDACTGLGSPDGAKLLQALGGAT